MNSLLLFAFQSTILIEIIPFTTNYPLNMPWHSLNSSLNLLCGKSPQHFIHAAFNSFSDVIGPFFVVSLFTQNQVGSIAFKSGELEAHSIVATFSSSQSVTL